MLNTMAPVIPKTARTTPAGSRGQAHRECVVRVNIEDQLNEIIANPLAPGGLYLARPDPGNLERPGPLRDAGAHYSYRSERTGSTRLARTAGNQIAAAATTIRIAGTVTNTSGSQALTP
jgi:hypothetical protein